MTYLLDTDVLSEPREGPRRAAPEVIVWAAAQHVPDPRPERDALIAATALVRNLVVVTRNTSDFEGLGVDVLNPWEG